MEEVEEYITQRQNMVAEYISTRPILDLCEDVERRPGTQFSKWWWDQEGLNLAGERTATVR